MGTSENTMSKNYHNIMIQNHLCLIPFSITNFVLSPKVCLLCFAITFIFNCNGSLRHKSYKDVNFLNHMKALISYQHISWHSMPQKLFDIFSLVATKLCLCSCNGTCPSNNQNTSLPHAILNSQLLRKQGTPYI